MAPENARETVEMFNRRKREVPWRPVARLVQVVALSESLVAVTRRMTRAFECSSKQCATLHVGALGAIGQSSRGAKASTHSSHVGSAVRRGITFGPFVHAFCPGSEPSPRIRLSDGQAECEIDA